MSSKNSVFARVESGELINIPEAMKLAGLTSQGAWGSAVKSHSFLKDAIVEKDAYHARFIERAAVEQYVATRGNRGPSDGLKWFRIRLTEADAESFRSQGYTVEKPTARKVEAEAEEAVA